MKRMAPITALSIGTLALASCGSDSADQESSGDRDERIEELENELDELYEEEMNEASGGSASDEEPAAAGGARPDDAVEGVHDVGDTFDFYSTDGMGKAEITWDAVEWVTTEDDREAAILSFSSDATESEAAVDQFYNTADQSGWHYVSDEGESTSFLDSRMDWEGAVTYAPIFGQEVLPGTVNSDEIMWFVTDERSGFVTYVVAGQYMVSLQLPDEPVGAEGSEAIQDIHEEAAEDVYLISEDDYAEAEDANYEEQQRLTEIEENLWDQWLEAEPGSEEEQRLSDEMDEISDQINDLY